MDPLTAAIRRRTTQITAYRFHLENERMIKMSRLSEKLQLARGVVGRQTAKIEARADAIIAQESLLEAQTDEAFAGHEALLNEAQRGLDALKRELALMSNDPLQGSGSSQEAGPPPLRQPEPQIIPQDPARAIAR
jgi:hypothetical protein